MKKFLLASFILVGQLLMAQVEFGLKAGVNLQEVGLSDFNEQTIEDVEQGSRELGYHGGAYLHFSLPFMYIQPEFIFTQINNTFSVTRVSEDPRSLDIGFHRFDIPLLAGLKAGPLRICAGPIASFNLGEDDVFDEGLRNSTWGYQAGVGLNIGKLRIDGRYEGPISHSSESITLDGQVYHLDARTNQFIISLGYALN